MTGGEEQELNEKLLKRALWLIGNGKMVARKTCHAALDEWPVALPAVSGLRLADILPLAISPSAPATIRRCVDHAGLFRLVVGQTLHAAFQRAIRELIENPAQYSQHYAFMNSPAYREAERHLGQAILGQHRASTIGDLLMLDTNEFGFYDFEPDDPEFNNRWQSPLATVRREQGGILQETQFYRVGEPIDEIDLRFVWARAWLGNACIATAYGYVIELSQPDLSDADFYTVCSESSETLGDFAYYAILEHGATQSLFRQGGVFYLQQWEVAKTHRGHGQGASLLLGAIEAIAQKHPAVGTIAVDLSPGQYCYPLPVYCPPDVRARYDADRRKLADYWEKIAPHQRLKPPDARTLPLIIMNLLTREESLDGMRDYFLAKSSPRLH